MSLDRKPVMVRLLPEAYDALELVANANDKDLGEVLREIAEDALLGRAHSVRVTAERLARAINRVNPGKGGENGGNGR
mgnify:CR=1 FL=1